LLERLSSLQQNFEQPTDNLPDDERSTDQFIVDTPPSLSLSLSNFVMV
jgi:hypothetical protein